MSAFTSALHDISEKCIPKSSTRSKRRNPWFNDECKTAINKRKSALRKFIKNPSCENHMHSKLARAKARRTIKGAKRTSWRQYVNKLNSRTPIKKVWDMIRKVSGKNKKSECVHIKSSNVLLNKGYFQCIRWQFKKILPIPITVNNFRI